MLRISVIALLAGSSLATASPAFAETEAPETHIRPPQGELHFIPAIAAPEPPAARSDKRLAIFTPTTDPIRTTIDFDIWDYALKQMVLSMGPPNRQGARRPDPILGTRIKQGPQSPYRLEGSMVLFNFLGPEVIASFTEYRQDLERVTETIDIAALPRNEQLAFWLNLHNVALLEQLAKEWPVREPRAIMVGGVPLDDARFITVKGIPVSLRDIREEIVFRNWKDPKVIYGFWRGEIGGPELQRNAFTGSNVGPLLDVAARDYVNSLRGTQKAGDTLQVAGLYAEVAPFYFPEFDADLRAHLVKYAEEDVAGILVETQRTEASIRAPGIADLHGGARPANYLFVSSAPGAMDDPLVGWSDRLGQSGFELMGARQRKLQNMVRRGEPIRRVYFSNIDLPGDPPNKNAVE
ncbi:MAG: DUF547 domain-containing protein [Porphyrobacter sp.]|nr:DUF547 domain-containing protein [Porphyrobacter sp.]